MKTTSLSAILAIILVTACSTNRAQITQRHADQLTGIWNCQSAVIDGKPVPAETTRLLRLTLTKDRYRTEKGDEVLFDSAYTVDSSKSPTQISMVGTEGDLTGKEAQGIYSMEGNTLRICYTMPGKPRPSAFESPAGSRIYLLVWKRQ